MINKRQKHKSQKRKKHKKHKNHKKNAKTKKQNQKQTKQVQLPKPEGGRKEKEKQKKEWSPVVSGALCMGVRYAQFESCMKPGVRFMGLGAVPWIGW